MKKVSFALIAIAIAATSAHAQTTVYQGFASRAAFESGLQHIIRDDYTNPGYAFIQTDAAMSAVLGETRYHTPPIGHINIVWDGPGFKKHYCAGCNGSFQLDFSATSLSTAGGVFGVGFDFFNAGQIAASAFVTFGDNSTASYLLPSGPIGLDDLDFFGITASAGIKSIEFGLAQGNPSIDMQFGETNLTIGDAQTVVPEPRTSVLLAAGLLGITLVARRRRQA